MTQPINKNIIIGVLGGTALAFIYLMVGGNKDASFGKTLLLGAGIGGGIGFLTEKMGYRFNSEKMSEEEVERPAYDGSDDTDLSNSNLLYM